MYYDLRTYLS